MKELEKSIVSMVRGENADIKAKNDPARLLIQRCQLVVINTYAPMVHPSDIKDSPLAEVRSAFMMAVWSNSWWHGEKSMTLVCIANK